MQQYYYSHYDRECGPCAESTIVNMIRSGISDVWVRRDGDDQWHPISDLPEDLFPFALAMRPSAMPPAAARATSKAVDVRDIEYKARTIVIVSWVFIGLCALGLFSTVLTGALSGNAGIFGASVLLGAVACAIGCLPFAIYLILGQSIRRLVTQK